MKRFHTKMTTFLFLLFMLFHTACTYVPTLPASSTPPLTKYVYTDSIGAEMLNLPGVQNSPSEGRQWNAMNGATLYYWWGPLAAAINTDPNAITLAIGGNDALTCSDPEGWSDNDHVVWDATFNDIHPITHVIAILPYAAPGIEDLCPGSLAAIDEATADIRDMAALHTNVTLLDWRAVAEAHPEYMCSDNIHLCSEEALQARFDMIVNAGG